MQLEATPKTAMLSGLIAGAILSQVESWSLSNKFEAFIMISVFLGSALFFAIGYKNIHVKVVISWNDLTEGEKKAFLTRVPIWFVSFVLSAFITGYVVTVINNT